MKKTQLFKHTTNANADSSSQEQCHAQNIYSIFTEVQYTMHKDKYTSI